MTKPSLVADIGGTNTRVALAHGTQVDQGTVTRYANREFQSLYDALETFLESQNNPDCAGVCVALAGPVEDGRGKLTNFNWEITETELNATANCAFARIFNDLQAQGYALPSLSSDNLHLVLPAAKPAPPKGACIVVGVGTGFNMAPVLSGGAGVLVPPAEAGHIELPVVCDLDWELVKFIRAETGFASVEDALSGRGLSMLYRFQSAQSGTARDADSKAVMAAFERGDDAQARAAVTHFAQLLGTVVGQLAFTQLAYGGVYLAGGVARQLAPHLHDLGFAERLQDKGRFSDLARRFAVYAIEDDFAALTGCATYLAQNQPSEA